METFLDRVKKNNLIKTLERLELRVVVRVIDYRASHEVILSWLLIFEHLLYSAHYIFSIVVVRYFSSDRHG